MPAQTDLQKVILLCVAAFIALLAIGGFYLYLNQSNTGSVECTLEAKLCPDGSYVGRTGPNCEFTACPGNKDIVEVGLGEEFTLTEGQTAEIADTGLQITVDRFYNNPCAEGVQCFWSGVGIGFRYTIDGDTAKGIDLVQAFGFQTTIRETDHETFARLVVEDEKNVSYDTGTKTDVLGGWKTYRNEKYGYEIQYPSDLVPWVETTTTSAGTSVENRVVIGDEDEAGTIKRVLVAATDSSEVVHFTVDQDALFCCEADVSSIILLDEVITPEKWREYGEIPRVPDDRLVSESWTMFAGRRTYEIVATVGIDSPGSRMLIIPHDEHTFVVVEANEEAPHRLIIDSLTFFEK